MSKEGGGCLLFSFLLFSIRYVRYLMTFWCNCFMSIMTSILDISSRFNSWLCSWTTPLTPVVIVTRGFTCMFIYTYRCSWREGKRHEEKNRFTIDSGFRFRFANAGNRTLNFNLNRSPNFRFGRSLALLWAMSKVVFTTSTYVRVAFGMMQLNILEEILWE